LNAPDESSAGDGEDNEDKNTDRAEKGTADESAPRTIRLTRTKGVIPGEAKRRAKRRAKERA
jgi:hypothetical protein